MNVNKIYDYHENQAHHTFVVVFYASCFKTNGKPKSFEYQHTKIKIVTSSFL